MKKWFPLLCITVLSVFLAGCGASEPPASARYIPGSYVGEGEGFGGTLSVSVTVDAERITAVEITAHKETQGIGTDAITLLPSQMVEKNTAQVDNISGATITSDALKEAVTAALQAAQAQS